MVNSPCKDCPDRTSVCRLNEACEKWNEFEKISKNDRIARLAYRKKFISTDANVYLLQKLSEAEKRNLSKRRHYGVKND